MCSFSFFSLEDSNVHIVQEPMLLQKRQLKTSLFSFAKQQFSVPNNSPPLRTATLVENETIQGQIGEGCPIVQMKGTTRPVEGFLNNVKKNYIFSRDGFLCGVKFFSNFVSILRQRPFYLQHFLTRVWPPLLLNYVKKEHNWYRNGTSTHDVGISRCLFSSHLTRSIS